MDLSLILLLLATVAFVGVHIVLSLPAVRTPLVARFGNKAFRGIYSLQSAILLVLTVLTYREASYLALWTLSWANWLPILVMPVALWLLVGALSTRNPTAAGPAENAAPPADMPLPLYTAITRHPMLWGILLWAIAHLLANGDLASLILFGGMAVLTVAGMWGIDAKKRANPAYDFTALAQRTSLIPFAATLAGRNRLAPHWGDAIRLGASIVLYVGILHAHQAIFGVSPFPLSA